ncbi:MAG: RtcB family protein [Sedimentisphaerales bacterium]|nr:RtcB family protein [Sedimentisphaerales bacterium]
MTNQIPKLEHISPNHLKIRQSGAMVTDADIFVSDRINLEPDALKQLCDAASVPFAKRVLATADIHVGFGVPIGCVMGLAGAIMPAAVGYDINCGMRLLSTPFQRGQIDTDAIAQSIARDIPLGEGKENLHLDKSSLEELCCRGVASIPGIIERTNHRIAEAFEPDEFRQDMQRIEDKGSLPGDITAVPKSAIVKSSNQLGTLGGGNHFIEIQYIEKIFDQSAAKAFGLEKNQIVVMIHSGSRRFGYEIADHYMRVAASLPGMAERGKMLSFITFDNRAAEDYTKAMAAAANFAYANRHIMALLVRRCFNRMFGPTPLELIYDVAHNMAKLEEHEGLPLWVHRKGATRAFGPDRMKNTEFEKTGQPIITPGSMGTASYLMVGTGNSAESLCSVNHGAGRVMSRTAALGKSRRGKVITPAQITDDQFKRSMKGIKLISANKSKVKEEAPDAYKDIDEVVRIVADCGWVKKVAKMRPLAVLKG